MSLTFFIRLPMKIEPIRSSETSVIKTQTPGNYPKRNILQYYLSLHSNTIFHITTIISNALGRQATSFCVHN